MTEEKTTPARKTAPKTTKAPAVYGSLLKVMEGLKAIPKNGKMEFGNTRYDYLRADDVQERINPLLIENNLIVRSEYDTRQINRGRGEGVAFVEVSLALTYISTVDGSELTVTAVGESQGTDDKSVNKALTQAIKNSHRAQFQFASGEKEPDDYPGVREEPATPAAVTRAKQNNNAPAVPNGLNAARQALVGLVGDQASAKRAGDEFYGVSAGEPSEWSADEGQILKLIEHLKAKG